MIGQTENVMQNCKVEKASDLKYRNIKNAVCRKLLELFCLVDGYFFFVEVDWKICKSKKWSESLNCVFVAQMFYQSFVHDMKKTFSRITRCQFSFLFTEIPLNLHNTSTIVIASHVHCIQEKLYNLESKY